MVISPLTLVAPEVTVPIVSITVAPPMTELPPIVPELIIGADRVLLVSVSVVFLPTKVSLVAGRTNIPPLAMALITGVTSVLLVSVSAAERVTTVPVAGNTAFELMPVPPMLVGSNPVSEPSAARSIAPNDGVPPAPGILKI